jgi:hypothetical protein
MPRSVPLVLSTLLLGGCTLGAPTYGTGTPSDVQLLDDVTGIITVTPKEKKHIDYKPRPELVRPKPGEEVAVLPPPQDDVATSSNPAWPESPEQRRARMRAEATANQDDSNYVPAIANDISPASSEPPPQRTQGTPVPAGGYASPEQQRKEFKRRMAVNNQGSPTERRYLSEPPLSYRQPAATAPADELGEDEWKKEKDRKRAARKKKNGTFFGDLWPF